MALADLRPDLRAAAYELVRRAAAAGVPVVVASTTRTPAEQDRLCRAGYSRLCGDKSAHVHGLAFDVALVDPSTGSPHWPTDPDGLARWTRVGELGEALGLVWGGRWSPPDWPHYQTRDAQTGVRSRIARTTGRGAVAWIAACALGLALLSSPHGRRRSR